MDAGKYDQILVSDSSIEPFILCLALGTLQAIKENVWTPEAGIWTIGRPAFLSKVEKYGVSEKTLNVLFQFGELNALRELSDKETFEKELLKMEIFIKEKLKNYAETFWRAE